MRLKEIKPGMVIHCKNEEEKKALLEEAERLGYHWIDSNRKPTDYITSGKTIHFYADKNITWSDRKERTTKFSDLVIPELTAEEVLRTLGEIKGMCAIGKMFCCDCPLHDGNNRTGLYLCDFENFIGNEEVVKEICAEWKSNHENKEPEIETVDICRIIEIQPDGRKRCMYEEDMEMWPDFPTGEESIEVEKILKRYCMEHDGEFIAVHETVSRVKR